MKAKEALEIIESEQKEIHGGRLWQAIEKAKEALGKRIAMEQTKDQFGYPLCPSCGESLDYEKYCYRCGQHVHYEDEGLVGYEEESDEED